MEKQAFRGDFVSFSVAFHSVADFHIAKFKQHVRKLKNAQKEHRGGGSHLSE